MEPRRMDVERARREAKALLAAARRGEPEALADLRGDRTPRLADAQRAIARRYGHRSWPELVRADRDLGAALRRAARSGDDDRVYALLEAGAPPNGRDPRTGRTALHLAAAADQLDTVSVLVTWVPVDLEARDRRNRTAVDLARPGSAVATVLASCSPDPARPPLASHHGRLVDEADVALLDHLSRTPGVDRHPLGDGFVFRTGLHDNTRNGIVCSRLPGDGDDGRDRTLERVIAALTDVPARWYLSHPTDPPDLPSRLQRLGCVAERSAVHMTAPLDAVGSVADRSVIEVGAAGDLLHLDRSEAALLAAAGPPLRHFVLPDVGGITTFVAGTTLLGVHLQVRRAARRNGRATTLVRHAAAVGEADGCRRAVLAPTAATIPLFERLGFRLERSRPDHWHYLPP